MRPGAATPRPLRHDPPASAGAAICCSFSSSPSPRGKIHIYGKLGVGDRAAAVAEAFNRGLLTPEPRDNPDRR